MSKRTRLKVVGSARRHESGPQSQDYSGTTAGALHTGNPGSTQTEGHYDPLLESEIKEGLQGFAAKWDIPPRILLPAVTSAMIRAIHDPSSKRKKDGTFIAGKATEKHLESLAERMYTTLHPPSAPHPSAARTLRLRRIWERAEKASLAGYLHIALSYYYPRQIS